MTEKAGCGERKIQKYENTKKNVMALPPADLSSGPLLYESQEDEEKLKTEYIVQDNHARVVLIHLNGLVNGEKPASHSVTQYDDAVV